MVVRTPGASAAYSASNGNRVSHKRPRAACSLLIQPRHNSRCERVRFQRRMCATSFPGSGLVHALPCCLHASVRRPSVVWKSNVRDVSTDAAVCRLCIDHVPMVLHVVMQGARFHSAYSTPDIVIALKIKHWMCSVLRWALKYCVASWDIKINRQNVWKRGKRGKNFIAVYELNSLTNRALKSIERIHGIYIFVTNDTRAHIRYKVTLQHTMSIIKRSASHRSLILLASNSLIGNYRSTYVRTCVYVIYFTLYRRAHHFISIIELIQS